MPEVTWQLDDQEEQSSEWEGSLSNETTYYLGSDQEFIWKLMNSDTLKARVLGRRGVVTATFQLKGLSEILGPYRDSCNWVGFEIA